MLLALIPASLTQIRAQSVYSSKRYLRRASGSLAEAGQFRKKVLVSVRNANVIGNRLTSLVEGRKSNPQIKNNQASGLAARLRKASRIPLELADRVALPFLSDERFDPRWRVLLS